MKLATALSKRSDLQIRLQELSNRLNNNAKVQEGQKPSEDPKALLVELNTILLELEELISQINLVNARTMVQGKSLTELLARRDMLKQRISIMRSFLNEASAKVDRYSRSEIKIESTVEVSTLQQSLDEYSKELRELDEVIQEVNWTTEL